MERYIFAGTLLVPMPKNDSNYTFRWIQTLNSANNTVNVIAFNTSDPNNFQPMLQADLKHLLQLRRQGSHEIGCLKLAGSPVDDNIRCMRKIKQQIRFIKSTLQMLSNSVYVKTPEQAMLDCLNHVLNKRLSNKEVVYLSWISHIEHC